MKNLHGPETGGIFPSAGIQYRKHRWVLIEADILKKGLALAAQARAVYERQEYKGVAPSDTPQEILVQGQPRTVASRRRNTTRVVPRSSQAEK